MATLTNLAALQAAWRAFLAGDATAGQVAAAWVTYTRWVGNTDADRDRCIDWITTNPASFATYLHGLAPEIPWVATAPASAATAIAPAQAEAA